MKYTFMIITAALLQVVLACDKIEKSASENGKPVTLQAGLAPDTKVSHALDGTTIKPAWEAGDQIEVVFTKNEAEVVETFTLSSGAGETNATFSCSSSQLEEGMNYSVYYPSRTCDWSEQDGTIANLPEYLVAEDVTSLSAPVALASKLTYFHFVLSAPTTIGSDTYSYAILTKNVGTAQWYKNNSTQGYITIKPQSNFVVNSTMEPLDFYLAILFNGNTSEGGKDMFGDSFPAKMDITLQTKKPNGVIWGVSNPALSFPYHYYSWSPSKDYQPGRIYKVSGGLEYEAGDGY